MSLFTYEYVHCIHSWEKKKIPTLSWHMKYVQIIFHLKYCSLNYFFRKMEHTEKMVCCLEVPEIRINGQNGWRKYRVYQIVTQTPWYKSQSPISFRFQSIFYCLLFLNLKWCSLCWVLHTILTLFFPQPCLVCMWMRVMRHTHWYITTAAAGGAADDKGQK